MTSPMGVFGSFRGPPHTHGRLCSPARGLRRGGQRGRVDTEPPEGLRGVGWGRQGQGVSQDISGTPISAGPCLCSSIRGLQEARAGAQGHFLLLMELNLNRP